MKMKLFKVIIPLGFGIGFRKTAIYNFATQTQHRNSIKD